MLIGVESSLLSIKIIACDYSCPNTTHALDSKSNRPPAVMKFSTESQVKKSDGIVGCPPFPVCLCQSSPHGAHAPPWDYVTLPW